MKILVVSDYEDRKIWDYYEPDLLRPYDLILAAGDLKAEYLTFLATMSRATVLYVPGNHDRNYEKRPPEGCVAVDGKIYVHNGIRILGLGGSMRYKDGPCMYTEEEMRRRVRRLWFPLFRSRGFDILLTHAPAKGVHDGEDLPHHGFQCFTDLIDRYKPKFFVHGHMHKNYSSNFRRTSKRGETTVVNACGKYVIEYPENLLRKAEKKKDRNA